MLEKPVGRDLKSFREIDDAVAHAFSENQVFRIDHYLGKETVQNLIALRFGKQNAIGHEFDVGLRPRLIRKANFAAHFLAPRCFEFGCETA